MQASADNTISKNIAKIKLPQIDGKKTLYRILKTSVIYGANASGKSNLFKAMDTIRQIIISSNFYHPNQEIPIDNFRLDMKCISQPTEFHFIFVQNNIKYAYQVMLTKKKILEESPAPRKSINKLIEFTKTLTDDELMKINNETDVIRNIMFVPSEAF